MLVRLGPAPLPGIAVTEGDSIEKTALAKPSSLSPSLMFLVGLGDGTGVSLGVGLSVGFRVGTGVGLGVGLSVGFRVGTEVGLLEGL